MPKAAETASRYGILSMPGRKRRRADMTKSTERDVYSESSVSCEGAEEQREREGRPVERHTAVRRPKIPLSRRRVLLPIRQKQPLGGRRSFPKAGSPVTGRGGPACRSRYEMPAGTQGQHRPCRNPAPGGEVRVLQSGGGAVRKASVLYRSPDAWGKGGHGLRQKSGVS